eukprot:TRINITY_DN23740_c1_g1_i1.p1 TRINITY_DN23740_c1_g1~~TRINITY_DN23740_c1_g1_i1.p1  ORF type:complete len:310 (+),score=54.18 TRINITY_DN23740_c1_g1_i1:95-1024(+)
MALYMLQYKRLMLLALWAVHLLVIVEGKLSTSADGFSSVVLLRKEDLGADHFSPPRGNDVVLEGETKGPVEASFLDTNVALTTRKSSVVSRDRSSRDNNSSANGENPGNASAKAEDGVNISKRLLTPEKKLESPAQGHENASNATDSLDQRRSDSAAYAEAVRRARAFMKNRQKAMKAKHMSGSEAADVTGDEKRAAIDKWAAKKAKEFSKRRAAQEEAHARRARRLRRQRLRRVAHDMKVHESKTKREIKEIEKEMEEGEIDEDESGSVDSADADSADTADSADEADSADPTDDTFEDDSLDGSGASG